MIGGGLPCPLCRTKLQLTLEFIFENPSSACPSCGCVMTFPRDDKLYSEYKLVKTEMDQLKKQMKNIL